MIYVLTPLAAIAYSLVLHHAVAWYRSGAASPHGALAPVPSLLASVVILLSSFLVVTGWAARGATKTVPLPPVVFLVDVLATACLLAYPALAGLPYTLRNKVLLGVFAAPVGAVIALAWDMQH